MTWEIASEAGRVRGQGILRRLPDSKLTGRFQGALVHRRILPNGIILKLRSEHENHPRAFANCSFPIQRVLTC